MLCYNIKGVEFRALLDCESYDSVVLPEKYPGTAGSLKMTNFKLAKFKYFASLNVHNYHIYSFWLSKLNFNMEKLVLKDVVGVLQCLEGMVDKGLQMETKFADKIGSIISRYSSKQLIDIHYAERLLTLTGKLMELNGEESIKLFCLSTMFIESLISLVCDFKDRLVNYSPTMNSQFSFTSHHCYEMSLFILLGIAEKSILIKEFLKTVENEQLTKLVSSLGAIIPEDFLYSTQVSEG